MIFDCIQQRSLSLLSLYRFIALSLYCFIALSIKDHYRFIAFFTYIQSKIIIAFIAFLLYCIIDQRSFSLLLLYHFFHLYIIKDQNRFYRFFALLHYRSKIIIAFITLLFCIAFWL